jgi:hypothetical protein
MSEMGEVRGDDVRRDDAMGDVRALGTMDGVRGDHVGDDVPGEAPQWSRGDQVSTEELRVSLQRYRAFFERLLSA